MKRELRAALFALALIGCLTIAALRVADMRRAWGGSAACSIAPATQTELSYLAARAQWTAYAQSAPVTVASDALPARTAQAAVLSFAGDPARIAFFPRVCGRLPLDGEAGACALDAGTAFALFNSTNAAGGVIRLNGKAWTVVGVVDVRRPIILTPAAQNTRLTRLVADDREALLRLASMLDTEPDPFEWSGAELAALMRLLCAAPCLIVAMRAAGLLGRRGGWRRIAAKALVWAVLLGAALLMLYCLPARFLPARWSDMTFYTRQLAAYRARPPRIPDVRDEMLRENVLRVGAWVLAAIAACLRVKGA